MKSSLAVVMALFALVSCILTGCSSDDAKPDQVAGTLAEADKAYWLGDTAKAHQWIENAVALLPNDPATYFNDDTGLGAVQITANHGDYAELVKVLAPVRNKPAFASRIVDIDGTLGDAYDRIGSKAQSIAAYKDQLADLTASTSKPGTVLSGGSGPPFLLAKGSAEWCSGDRTSGRTDMLDVYKTEPTNAPEAANDLAYMEALARENLPEAESLANFAVSKAEASGDTVTTAMYQDTLGWVLHQEGKDQAALPYCQLASNNIPQVADCTYHLAAVYEALGDDDNARKAYQRVVSLQPLNAEAKAGLVRVSSGKATT